MVGLQCLYSVSCIACNAEEAVLIVRTWRHITLPCITCTSRSLNEGSDENKERYKMKCQRFNSWSRQASVHSQGFLIIIFTDGVNYLFVPDGFGEKWCRSHASLCRMPHFLLVVLMSGWTKPWQAIKPSAAHSQLWCLSCRNVQDACVCFGHKANYFLVVDVASANRHASFKSIAHDVWNGV